MDAARVRRLAQMLRIGLAKDEVRDLARELTAVLERIDPLDRVELPGAERDSTAGSRNPPFEGPGLRPDEPGADPLTLPPDSFAPATRDGWFIVPRVR